MYNVLIMKKLSVVIPAYNEEKNLNSGVLSQVYEFLEIQKYNYEVLIVDDGSKDKTKQIIKNQIKKWPKFNLIENSHGGKAIAVMTGLLKAAGDIILFTDMDQATPIVEVNNFLSKFDSGYNIVIGSRKGRQGAPVLRKITAWGFVILRNFILGLPFTDTQCGFKAFDQKAVKAIFPPILDEWQKFESKEAAVNAGFDVEFLFYAKKLGFKIGEIPVEWHYVGSERVHFFKDSTEAVKGMIRIRINDLFGKYQNTAKT